MKKWLLFASALCLVFVLAACGANTAKEDNKEANTTAADSGSASDLVVTASNWKFDQKEYKIKAGETVNLKLDSVSGLHGLQIQKTDYQIANGKTVAVNISEPGSYEMICTVPCGTGHREMKATLVVE
ncbi:cytochrome c oxidase subunit 2 [Paenibacillus endophyticus]|uniref:Cytochrome c oxidase subunit 2 n=1 Tax=Paenibacillus endophyticus TaxID=1294268 RepID=A0A7W5C2H0_9BACL|nr:cytochrome C oxidase subunit II [Paenibacillus endophyticus]MBB3149988.1 cytochrome c oxidase subunit 2 [Paenibacillus endophyticus]